MEKAIEILKKELKGLEYKFNYYERAKVLQYIDVDEMKKKIDGLKYSIDLLERDLLERAS